MFCRHWLTAVGFWMAIVAGVSAAPPYKALIVDGQNAHDWKNTTPVLKRLLEDSKLFVVDVATSPPKGQDNSNFKPDFAAYQVVIGNYQGDAWPEATRQAFVDYVRGGGGYVVYHFACAAFPEWPEYNEIIGLGGWGGRNEKHGPYVRWKDGQFVRDTSPGKGGGHGPMQPFQLVIRNPNHPVTKGLPEKFMHVPDELYGWLRGPAKNLTILATAFAPTELGGAGEHEPLLFTVGYGKGRAIHLGLGHSPKELHSVAFIVLFQRAAEWAATGQVTQPVPADFPTADTATVRQ